MMPYKLIRDLEEWDAIQFDPDLPLFCDTETCRDYGATDLSKKPGGLYGKVRLYQFYQTDKKFAYLVDCYFVDLADVLAKVEHLHHVYHNASYDLHTINCHTPEHWYPREVSDTFYLSKAVYTCRDNFGFYDCLRWCGAEDDFIRSIDKKTQQKSDWGKALSPEQLDYAAADVLYLAILYEKVKHGMDEPCRLDHDNMRYATQYDRKGMPVSEKAVAILRREMLTKLETNLAHVPVNINSSKQCCEWLGTTDSAAYTIGTMALKGNTDAEHLVKSRQAEKALQFIEKYDRPVMRAFHNSCGARTSRMTCSGGDRIGYDNLQNPARTLYPVFQAPRGSKLVYSDYAGLELRTVTAYVGEPTMARLMKEGVDMHTYTGAFIFDTTEEGLTKQQRWCTKVFTFSNAYGAGPVELQNQLQAKGRILMELEQVIEISKRWFELYHYFKEWHNMHRRVMQVYGYIDTKTLLGRTLRASRINDTFNYPIQGSAAEVTKYAVHYLYERYGGPGIVNVVHDSITLLQPDEEAAKWLPRLNECMVDAWEYVVQYSAIPDLPMPPEAKLAQVYPGVDETDAELKERGLWPDEY